MRPKAVSQPATGAVRQRGKHRAGGRVFNADTAEKRAHSPFAPGIALPKRGHSPPTKAGNTRFI
ncbi:hypothetical protein [Geobacillus icigianus]|uniref:hypothetical protein n=1 Tax=Geobacillus icigianus TaxID=1430331 RepID=UPI0005045F9B|nr:hypothetical protein [Geobacillus icigianus]